MNHDETFSDGQTLEPELEARIVAWVAGEASAFEAAELERIIAQRPQARAFFDRMNAANRLLGQAARPDPAPLRMSSEKRAKLLAALGEKAANAPQNSSLLVYNRKAQTSRRVWRRFMTVAAGVMIGLGVFNVARYSGDRYGRKAAPALRMREEVSPRNVQAETEARAQAYERAVQRKKEKSGPERKEFNIALPAQSSGESAHGSLSGPQLSADLKDVGSAITVAPSEGLSLAKPKEVSAMHFGIPSTAPAAAPSMSTSGSLAWSGDDARDGSVGGVSNPEPPRATEEMERRLDQKWDALSRSRGLAENSNSVFLNGGSPDQPLLGQASLAEDKNEARLEAAGGSNTPVDAVNLSAFAAEPAKRASGDRAEKLEQTFAPAPGQKTSSETQRSATPAPSDQEINAQQEPVSTFSLHVSDVSFRTAQSALAHGIPPSPETIRAEEFYNAFHYDEPTPALTEKVSCRIEQSAHPFLQQRNFVRIAMKVPSVGRSVAQPLRLTVLLDTSGSMEREDRAAAVKRAFATLVSLLGPNDRVTLIGFSRQSHLLAENVAGPDAAKLLSLVERTNPEGGTNIEEALRLGSEQALKLQTPNAQNRIVLLTDGAANLGDAKPDDLMRKVEALRQHGIAFDACGVGLDGVDDTILEALTRKGDGRYCVLDTPEAADANFAQQLAGAFRPAAKNVKVQVRFNPARVANYRLIGFEKHRLSEADFRNDAVDAAELAADEAAVALYQVQVQPQGEGELGEVFVRFRDVATGNMVERSWTMPYEPQAAAFAQASPTLQLTGASALLAEKLAEDPAAETFQLKELAPVVSQLRQRYHDDRRVQEFATMFEQYRRMKSE